MILRAPGAEPALPLHQLSYSPCSGPMFRKLYLSRGLRMVGTMAGAGVSLVDCVKTAQELCDNSYFKDLWTEVSQQIQAGKQFSDPLFRNAPWCRSSVSKCSTAPNAAASSPRSWNWSPATPRKN